MLVVSVPAFVGTEKGDTGERLDGSDMGNDGVVLDELLGTDDEGDVRDSVQGDGEQIRRTRILSKPSR